MVLPRVIPTLLIKDGGLVKTTKFLDPTYVGDPINVVKIFNEKNVDELLVVDIDATIHSRPPNFDLIEKIATVCRAPLSIGGGIKTVEDAKRIINCGVEKVCISSAAITNKSLISQLSLNLGRQSVVVVADIKTNPEGKYFLWSHNATIETGEELVSFAKEMEALGAGELVVNSIDQDGTMKGYDEKLAAIALDSVSLPVTIIGGAGKLSDVEGLFKKFGLVGAGVGSLFVFWGLYKAVLVNYPSTDEHDKLTSAFR
jgi:cyclase